MRIPPGHRRRSAGPGFTLVELLLTVSLLLLMVGAGILNFGPAQGGARLDEGATQVESLFRYARAQAASSGRTVRIVFPDGEPVPTGTNSTSTVPGVQVAWETDPLGAPGQFEPLPEAEPYTTQIGELVRVRPFRAQPAAVPISAGPSSSSSSSSTSPAPTGLSTGADTPSAPQALTILFYPDGSSDSAEVVLGSLDEGDAKQMAIKLSGLTGVLRRRSIEIVAGEAAPEAPLDPPR
jgi:type II secretory pathway pseudopilin PulG